ncbi:MAG: hypothetical protein Q9217_000155 [Psora testacea]
MADARSFPAPAEPPPSYETTAQHTPTKPSSLSGGGPLPLNIPLLNSLRDKRVILASASPRRKQLLAQIGLTNIEISPSSVPENLPKTLSPFEYVLQTATQKATSVYTSSLDSPTLGDPAVVIAADTVVVSHSGQVLEKPRSEMDHIGMLKKLRNSAYHKVYTGVVVMAPLVSARDPGYALESTVEETTVRFGRDLSDEMLLAYVRTREGADKAGGYGIQGIGALLVDKIEGNFDNAIGLPLRPTMGLIEKVLESAEAEDLEDEFAGGGEEDD